MAASPVRLDRPPVQPPEVSAQLGGGATQPGQYGNMAAAFRDRLRSAAAPGGGGVAATAGANPQGALLAQSEAIKKVLDQMSRMNDKFAPFANRMVEVMNAGLGAALAATPTKEATGAAAPGPPPELSSTGGASFPG